MVELLPSIDHVAAFRLSGVLTEEDMDKIIAELESKLKGEGKVSVYSDLTELGDITGEALTKRVRYGFSKLAELNRFDRMAVISDKFWIRAVAGWTSRLFPQIEVKVFGSKDRQKAAEWVSRQHA